MLFFTSFTIGLIVLLTTAIFLGAVFYHLTQYQLPGHSPRKSLTIILFFSLALILLSAFLFFIIPWPTF
jgi:uncharacterized membrane-anchored protein